jgi:L-ascorbate metabolism protein UlaG (beta-lactamase superfamily)
MHPFEDLVVPNGSAGVHWFGQSSYAFKDPAGTIVQVDPYFPRERPAETFMHARPPLHEEALRTDFVLLTHNHGDHTCVESLLRIRSAYPEVRFVGPVESVRKIQEAGIPADMTESITAGDAAEIGTMKVHAVWSKPPQGIPENDINPPDVQHLGYVVDTGDVRLYVSGDNVNTFGDHEALCGPIRALKPDIGFITTHPNEGEFPFFDGAAKIGSEIGLKTAVPSHYQCFIKRNYDPEELRPHLGNVELLIIPYNQAVVYAPNCRL